MVGAEEDAELVNILQSPQRGAEWKESLTQACRKLEEEAKAFASNDQAKLRVWRLADSPSISAALRSYFSSSQFGRADDPVCEWLYNWLRGSEQGSPLRRFVSRFAPLAVFKYLQQCATAQAPGLEAVLIAFYELQPESSTATTPIDVTQPSVYHTPASSKPQGSSRPSLISVNTGNVPPAVAAVLSFSMHVAPKRSKHLSLLNISAADRGKVCGAALHAFNSWLHTYPLHVLQELCTFAYNVGACGRPWMQEEVERKLKQFDIPLSTVLCDAPLPHGPSAAVRFPLLVPMLQQMCLGLARASHLGAAHQPSSSNGAVNNASTSSSIKSLALGAAASLHAASAYHLIPEAMLTSQAALQSIHLHMGQLS